MTTDAWVHFDITPPHTGWIRCIAPNDAILLPKRVLSVQLLLFSSRVFSSSPSFLAVLIIFRPDERTKCSYHPSSSSCFLNHSMNWSNPLYYTNKIENNTIKLSRAHIAHSGRHAIATWLLVLVSALAWPVVVSSGLLLSCPCLHDTPSYTPRHARCDVSAKSQPYATALLPLLGAWNLVGVPKLERQERPDECTGQVKVKRTFES